MRKSQKPVMFSIHTHDNRDHIINYADAQNTLPNWKWINEIDWVQKFALVHFEHAACNLPTSIVCLAVSEKFPRVYFTTDDTFRICTFIIYFIELIISKHFAGVSFYFILSIACSSISFTQENKWNFVCKRHLPKSNNLLSSLIIIICKLLFNSFFVRLRRQRGCMMLETEITFSIHWIFPLSTLWS